MNLAKGALAATPPDQAAYAWAQLTLGLCLVRWEDLPGPVDLLRQAEAALTTRGSHWGALQARTGLLLAAMEQRSSADLLVRCDSLAKEWEAAGWPLEAARLRINQMRQLNTLGRPNDALALAATIAPLIARNGTATDQALLARFTGVGYLQSGDYFTATALLDQAEKAFQQLRQPVELTKTWFEQARLAFYQDNFQCALALNERALVAFTQLEMPLRVALCYKNIGAIRVKLGQTDRAIAALLKARGTFATIGQLYQAAECELNLGNVAYHNGLYDLALGAWRVAEDAYSQLGVQGQVLVSRRNQADGLIALKQFAEAESLIATLIPEATRLGAKRDLPEILDSAGTVFEEKGDIAAAKDSFQQAEAMFAALPNRPAAARMRLAQGWLHLREHNLAAAEHAFQQAADGLAGSPIYHWKADYGLGRCAEQRGDVASALVHYQRASDSIAERRRAVADLYASSALFREGAQLFAAAVGLAASSNNAAMLLALSEQQRALALQQQLHHEPFTLPPALQATYETRRAHIQDLVAQRERGSALDTAVNDYLTILLQGRHVGTLPDTTPAEPLDLMALRHAFAAHYGTAWTALVYVSSGNDLLAVTLTDAQCVLDRIPLDKTLRRRLERASLPSFREYTYRDQSLVPGAGSDAWADLDALGAHLIPPTVLARLHPDHRLLIVPGGPLHSLPWAALRVNGAWLVQQAVPHLLPGLHIWPELAQRVATSDDALLIGISEFAGRANDLPSAIPSLDLAQQHWRGSATRMENGAVTRAALRVAAQTGALRRYGLIHVATHGQLTAGRGLLAHLKLADDDLLADEVAELGLGGALVVLAACDGALGEALPGEELVSLSRAFLAAGARDVIASLWKLYDQMVLPVLEPLYAALATGMDAAAALAQTQRICIAADQHDPAFPLSWPLVWASLSATGAGTVDRGRLYPLALTPCPLSRARERGQGVRVTSRQPPIQVEIVYNSHIAAHRVLRALFVCLSSAQPPAVSAPAPAFSPAGVACMLFQVPFLTAEC